MYVTKYFYKYATEDMGDYKAIKDVPRSGNAADIYSKMFQKELSSLSWLHGRVAVLLASGPTVNQAESQDALAKDKGQYTVGVQKPTMAIKSLSSYSLHKYIKTMGIKPSYASINANTCASSLYALREAEKLFCYENFEYVVIIAEERISFNTVRIFKEHNIDLIPSDGFACMVLSADRFRSPNICDCKWHYEYNNNPFAVTADGYQAVDDSRASFIKLHGSGTKQNTESEEALTRNRNSIEYKSKIGHSQGASGLLEICMAIDDNRVPNGTLCVASGLGGFYGSTLLYK